MNYNNIIEQFTTLPLYKYFSKTEKSNKTEFQRNIPKRDMKINHIISINNDDQINTELIHNIEIKAHPDVINILTNDTILKAQQNNCQFIKTQIDRIIISCNKDIDVHIFDDFNKKRIDGIIQDNMSELSVKATDLVKSINSQDYPDFDYGDSFF